MFVQRDINGKIIMAAGFTPGVAEEEVADDAPELIAFLNPQTAVVSIEPRRIACAMRIVIEEDAVKAVGGSFRVAGVVYLDTGTFLAVFSENLGEAAPFTVPDNGISISVSEWGGDYAILEVRDHAGGTLLTPQYFGFSLYNF